MHKFKVGELVDYENKYLEICGIVAEHEKDGKKYEAIYQTDAGTKNVKNMDEKVYQKALWIKIRRNAWM